MREIRFRAWDKENKKMIYDSDIRTSDYYLLITLHGTLRDCAYGQLDSWSSDKGFELSQYTGLKDKNGKEIYEGDIVKVWRYKSDYWDETEMIEATTPHEVKWMLALPNFGHWSLVDLKLYDLQYVGGFDKLEVIGNIYENPELLKV